MTRAALTAALGLGVRAARRKAGLTQVRLGAEVGLDPATIGNLERGSGSLSSLNKVMARLGLTLRSRALPDGPTGPTLALLRRWLKRSRRALVRELDLSRETLAALEAGRHSRVETLIAYAVALGVLFELEPVDAPRVFFTGTAAGLALVEPHLSAVRHSVSRPASVADACVVETTDGTARNHDRSPTDPASGNLPGTPAPDRLP